MTKEQAYKLYTESGNEVAVHGCVHYSLPDVPDASATADIVNDRIALEEMFGTIVTGMAYAMGTFSDKAVEILKNCGIEYARTAQSTGTFDIPTDWLRLPATCHHKNPRLMKLGEEFLDMQLRDGAHAPKLFYLWGHSYEFDDNDNWNVIEDFCEYIGGKDDVWYATNIEIFEYIEAYNRLVWGIDAKTVKNPTAIDVWVNVSRNGENLGHVQIKAGETLSF